MIKNDLNIIYSLATPADELAIIDLLKNLEGDRADFSIERFYVAKSSDRLVGCIRTKKFASGHLELASLAVDRNYQHQGIGSKLIEELLSNETHRPIFLLTALDKEDFYKRFNFKIIDSRELPDGFKKEYDRIISLPFAKNLQVIAMTIE